MKARKQPIIVMGMHRSGTTMIAKILQDAGLFIGWELDTHREAMFFLRTNETILKVFGGGWDNPTVIDHLFEHPEIVDPITRRLCKDLNSISVLSYLGPKFFVRYRSVFGLDIPWGWKDPRNTFLLPLWLRIFPGAKIIHVYRNGIDVAQSLRVRERHGFEAIHTKKNIKETVLREILRFQKSGSLLYLADFFRLVLRNMDRLSRYENLSVHPCISLDVGLDLWCIYLERAFSLSKGISNEVLHIKYEDFLNNPKNGFPRLVAFCDLSPNERSIREACQEMNPQRGFAFKNDDELVDFYRRHRKNRWMKKLGYDDLC